MKTKLLSFLAVLTCLCFCVSPLCVGAEIPPVVIEILSETVFSYLIEQTETGDGTPSGFAGGQKEWTKQIFEKAFEQPLIDPDTGEASFVLHNYDFITGKYQLHTEVASYNSDWTVDQIIPKDYLVEVTMCVADLALGYYTDPSTGVTYWANGLNIAITEPENWVTGSNIGGTVKHYFVSFPLNFNYGTQVKFSSSGINVSAQSNCTLYSVSGGSRSVMQNNFYTGTVIFSFMTDNDINVSANSAVTPPSNTNVITYTQYPVGIYSNSGSSVSSPGIDHPVDIDICHGSFMMAYRGYRQDGSPSAVSGKPFRCNEFLKCGFVTTNNPNHSSILLTNNVDNSEKNYYISNYQGGTVIDKDSDIGTKIAPVFELDPSLPDFLDDLLALIPTLLELLDGDFLGDMAGLIGALVDFFSHMPDIGLEWNNDNQLNTNNYYEVDFPSYNPPDSGGGGSGGDVLVTVDVNITRPLVSEVVTSYWLEVDVSTETTATYPVAVVSAAPVLWNKSDDIINGLELMPVYGILALVGVAVAVLYKGV